MIYVYREREREREKIILWWSLSSLFSLDLLLTFTDSEGLQPPSNREHLSLFGMKLWQTSTDTTLDCTVNDTLVDHGFKPTQVDPIDTGEGFCSQCERSCLNPAVCLHIIGFWRKIWGKPGKPESPYLAYRQGTWRQSFLQDLGLWQGCKQWLASRRHSRRQPVSQARLGNRTVGNFESLLAHTHTHIYIWYIYIHTYVLYIYVYIM